MFKKLFIYTIYGIVVVGALFLIAANSTPKIYRDGTFQAASQADRYGYAWVLVTLKDGKIVDVKIKEFDGLGVEKLYNVYGLRFPMLEEMHKQMAKNFVEKNSWEVDVFTGATSSSKKIIEAVKFALERAKNESASSRYFDGTFMGKSDSTNYGWGLAWVTIENDKIVNVILEEVTPQLKDGKPVYDEANRQMFTLKTSDYPYFPYHEAKQEFAKRIVEKQSYQIDAYTGATVSSNQWAKAVERALESARTRED
ncbi:FMN-binding protein [Thermotoga profunda]|uniref:FMN-binding protein n=1 Tax=Thermotoga profunda TaxID=1508420 RepID=UPI0006943AF9|nr:FMN-binding protein [Thermotoga profunda]